MKVIKIPRKLKKGLKKSIINKFKGSNLQTEDIRINNISTDQRFLSVKTIPQYKNIAVTAHTRKAARRNWRIRKKILEDYYNWKITQ